MASKVFFRTSRVAGLRFGLSAPPLTVVYSLSLRGRTVRIVQAKGQLSQQRLLASVSYHRQKCFEWIRIANRGPPSPEIKYTSSNRGGAPPPLGGGARALWTLKFGDEMMGGRGRKVKDVVELDGMT